MKKYGSNLLAETRNPHSLCVSSCLLIVISMEFLSRRADSHTALYRWPRPNSTCHSSEMSCQHMGSLKIHHSSYNIIRIKTATQWIQATCQMPVVTLPSAFAFREANIFRFLERTESNYLTKYDCHRLQQEINATDTILTVLGALVS